MDSQEQCSSLSAQDRFRLAQAVVVGGHELAAAEAIATEGGALDALAHRLSAALGWLAVAQQLVRLSGEPAPASRFDDGWQLGQAANPNSTGTERRFQGPALASRQPTVLVVDDDLNTRMLLKTVLEAAGYVVALAENGRVALGGLQQALASLDVVLIDVDLPEMSGVELFTELRARGLQVPVVFMSSGTNARATAVAYGADGYVAKPFDLETVLGTLGDLLPDGQTGNREARRRGMSEALHQFTLVVVNSNDDLLRLLGEVGEAAGFAVVTVHADEVGRTAEAIRAFLQRHQPKVVVYDVSPPYPQNWALFCSVRDAEQLAESGRQFVVTTPNKAALERFVGTTAAIELVAAETDRQLIAEAIRSAATA
jgi:CheY-like chemotaxis protein